MTIIGDLLYKLYETFFLAYEIKKKKVGYIRSCLNFIEKNTLEFHSLIFGIFEILFNLFLLFFFDNSPLLTAKK